MARSRGIISIVQYVKHPLTGEELISEEIIIGGLSGLKGAKKSAFVLHDRDRYKESDIKHQKERLQKEYISKQNEFKNEEGMITISMDDYVDREMSTTYSYIKIGELKPPHYHIVILPKNDLDLETVANIFGVPTHFVEVNPNRKNGTTWYDCVKYLTHTTTNAKKERKFEYPNTAVVCFGFSYDEEMEEYERQLNEYGKALSQEEEIFLQVLRGMKTPLDIRKENELLYIKYMDKLKKLHCDYLSTLPLPPFRLNIYVEGNGGEGKGQFTKYLARNLASNQKFFKVGGNNVTFEGYKGEEVIVWDDFRGHELMKVFEDEGKVLDYLDPFPDEDTDQKQHIKHDYTKLVNRVNIFNSVQPFEEFLLDLVKGNKETGILNQSYRRLPIIIRIHQEDYDILMNCGFLHNTREWMQYEAYNHIRGNFGRIASACKKNKELRDKIMGQAMLPVLDQIEALEGKIVNQEMSDDDIEKMFSDVGTFDFKAIEEDERKKDLEKELAHQQCKEEIESKMKELRKQVKKYETEKNKRNEDGLEIFDVKF